MTLNVSINRINNTQAYNTVASPTIPKTNFNNEDSGDTVSFEGKKPSKNVLSKNFNKSSLLLAGAGLGLLAIPTIVNAGPMLMPKMAIEQSVEKETNNIIITLKITNAVKKYPITIQTSTDLKEWKVLDVVDADEQGNVIYPMYKDGDKRFFRAGYINSDDE